MPSAGEVQSSSVAVVSLPVGSVLVVLVQHVPAYSLQGQIENLYMKFSCHHMKRDEWNVSEEPGYGRIIFSSTCMCDGWWGSCWPAFYLIHITHVTVLFATMSGFVVFSLTLQKLPCWCFTNVPVYVNLRLVLPQYCCHVTPCPYLSVTVFQSHFLGL